MKKASLVLEAIKNNELNQKFNDLYVDSSLVEGQKERYIKAILKFIELYGDQDIALFSTPGRSEVCGNHTDHQHGEVLAAAINLDIIAIVSKNDVIKVLSDDYDLKPIDLSDLHKKEE